MNDQQNEKIWDIITKASVLRIGVILGKVTIHLLTEAQFDQGIALTCLPLDDQESSLGKADLSKLDTSENPLSTFSQYWTMHETRGMGFCALCETSMATLNIIGTTVR